ncbi:MAG TPA: hypothetical protein VK603_13915, partial [Candidatus Saccharimonadales bacterium]|nr:hypothetical protein [Candidatus Saccharimonadales bacterium]
GSTARYSSHSTIRLTLGRLSSQASKLQSGSARRRNPRFDAGMGEQTLFKNAVREVASQRPRKPGG